MKEQAFKKLLYSIADDQLILGHRNSEWTGLGPLLEEDIAFSSMAQDKVGHSLAFYELLSQMGEGEPDTIAFMRNQEDFMCCQFVELPIGDYSFSLMRHFLYDHAEMARMELLMKSEVPELASLAKKLKGELIYHSMHGDIWIKKLGTATEESISKMQNAFNECIPYALGMFESVENEGLLLEDGIYQGEQQRKVLWLEKIETVLNHTKLNLDILKSANPKMGGRAGKHTEFLQPLIEEMAEVIRIDPSAEW